MRGEWCSQKIKEGKKVEKWEDKELRTELASGLNKSNRERERERKTESCVYYYGLVAVCLCAPYSMRPQVHHIQCSCRPRR